MTHHLCVRQGVKTAQNFKEKKKSGSRVQFWKFGIQDSTPKTMHFKSNSEYFRAIFVE